MKKLILCLFILFPINLLANVYDSPMKIYKPNYFIAGDREDQVKFQVSAKYNLFYPSSIGWYVAYTQRAFWNLYNDSAPFWEFNHEPEIFFLFESNNNPFGWNTGILDHIQLSPIFHRSNGKDGLDSRSMNLYCGEVQVSIGQVYNTGLVLKGFNYYSTSSKNKDIDQYLGFGQAELFFQLKSKTVEFFDKEKIYIRGGGNFESKKGWLESGLKVRLVTSKIQPFFYIQVFHGYGEAMVNYDKKDTAVRFGLIFE